MCLFSFLEKYHLNYHDVHTLHYLSQGYPPKETQQQLQNHFEAWKVQAPIVKVWPLLLMHSCVVGWSAVANSVPWTPAHLH